MGRDMRITGRMTYAVLAAALAAAASFLVGVPAAQAGPATPEGFNPVVADKAAAAMTADTGLSTADAMRRLASQQAKVSLGERLVTQLGASSAGLWLDQKADAVVVNVLDQQAADTVRKAGATAKIVAHGTDTLESVRDQLAATLPTDASVGIDVSANQVVVQIGPKATGSKLSALESQAHTLGSLVRVTRLDESFSTLIEGGYPIVDASGGRCSLGFNTTGGTGVTAGHCTGGIPQWWEGCCGGGYFGPSIAANFPGDDFGLIRNDGGLAQNGWVYLYNGTFQDIGNAADPYYGLYVCKSGSTTGLTCGYVYATGVTACYPEGCVDGLAQSNAYAAPGDSGGSWFNGGWAIGLTSGGGGGWTFFQPVVEALNTYGVWVF
jgi:streptogrisin D